MSLPVLVSPPTTSPAPRTQRGAAPAHRAGDGLPRGQQHAIVGVIVAAHVALAWGLLQVQAVREALVDAAPIFVHLIDAPTPPTPPVPKLQPPPPMQRPVAKAPPPPTLITTAPPPVPAVFVAPFAPEVPPPPAPPVPPAPPAPVAVQAPPAPPAPVPPKEIPASAVEYLVRPAPEYPRQSIRLRETGLVIVRVEVDEAGLPRGVHVAQSSGFVRLDEAALSAVKKARFKPYTENGTAVAAWTRIPFPFELEK